MCVKLKRVSRVHTIHIKLQRMAKENTSLQDEWKGELNHAHAYERALFFVETELRCKYP